MKSIFVISDFFFPGSKAGGALRSIFNLVNLMENHIHLYIYTRDRDLGDIKPYENIILDTWIDFGRHEVKYVSKSSYKFYLIVQEIRKKRVKILYYNSFFSSFSSFIVYFMICFNMLSDIKVIIAPRGEFSKGALELKKCKKSIFIYLFKLANLHKKITFHASTVFEKMDIINKFGDACDIKIALDPVETSEYPKYLYSDKILRIIFASRISPKKNLLTALKIVGKLKIPCIFDIYGPIEDSNYWAKCLDLIRKLSENIKCQYKGTFDNSDSAIIFSKYDLFLFPTQGENFGHIILESMRGNCYVLLSNKTPWKDLKMYEIGEEITSDDINDYVFSINKFYKNIDFYRKKKNNLQTYLNEKMGLDKILEDYLNLFEVERGI
jgi:glycosyltransferase involved in cell wall biosynthesis